MSKGAQIAGGATLVALLLGWYAISHMEAGSTFTYYQTLAEFQGAGTSRAGEYARVHGYVATGSIERDLQGRRVRFAVQNEPPHAVASSGPTLDVLYASLETPDLFKDGAEVVLEGRLERASAGDVFHADKVLAKCPSKFQAEPARTASF
jgi:cytochrome c-type biogenesis protein CcmE